MKKIILFFLLISLFPKLFSENTKSAITTIIVDFNKGMNIGSQEYKAKFTAYPKKKELDLLRELYKKNHFSKIKRSTSPKIPKIIHQIWVGTRQIPKCLITSQSSWKKFHPNWKYCLWTNEEAEKLVLKYFRVDHKEIYFNSEDPREKADLLRYYILFLYGGLYVDADCICLKSLEELHHYYDFYTGISSNFTPEICNNAVIGSAIQHPIMKGIIKNIKNINVADWRFRSGVFYFSKQLLLEVFKAAGKNIILPQNSFYALPLGYHLKDKPISYYIKPESIAIHYWNNSSNPTWQ
ncbi:MAG: hypothetical protein Tsb0015_08350 [Simkaniaceae bacterium]